MTAPQMQQPSGASGAPAGAKGAAARAAAQQRQDRQRARQRAEQAARAAEVRDARRPIAARLARVARTSVLTSTHTVLGSVYTGSGLLLSRWQLRARLYSAHGESTGDRWTRYGLIWAPAPAGATLALVQPGVLWLAVPTWCVLAVRTTITAETVAALRRHLLATAATEQPEPEQQTVSLAKATDTPTAGPSEAPEMDPALLLCWQLIGTAPGVHLSALAEAFTRLRPDAPVTPSDMRQWADEIGVPVRASVKGRKKGAPAAPLGVSQGVHRDDLQAVTGPAPDPLPPPPPDVVAQAVAEPVATSSTQVNGGVATPVAGVATRSTTAPTSGPVIKRDPDHPNRYSVQTR